MKDKLTPSRYASRTTDDLENVKRTLNESLVCTISYVFNGEPFALPTGFCLMDDRLIIHGSIKSHFLETLIRAKKACITTFLLDGLVMATSAFEHSVNYRSVVIFSNAVEITNHDEKEKALHAFTDKYAPDRWPVLRPITDGEIQGTKVLAFDIAEASLKQRSGPPSYKNDDWYDKIWTGIIPVKAHYDKPIQNPNQKEFLEVPQHINQLIKSQNT